MMKNIPKKPLVILSSLLLVLVAGIAVSNYQPNNAIPGQSANEQIGPIHISGPCKIVSDDKGNVLSNVCQHNLLTTVGVNSFKAAAGQGASIKWTKLSIGNSTTTQAIGDTALGGEFASCGLDPQEGTYVTCGNGCWNVTYTWTSTCDNVWVNATGVYNSTGSNQLIAETAFATGDTLQTNYKYNITWGFQINAG